jgi:lysophospholipase L1-like esterase
MKRKSVFALFFIFLTWTLCSSQAIIVPDSIYPPSELIISGHGKWTKENYPNRIKEFKNNPLNFNDIVFLGNSLTEGGKDWAKRFNVPNVKNRGISGDNTAGVLERLGEIYYFKASKVFILIGGNDFYTRKSPDFIVNNIFKIVDNIHLNSSETEIYVQTMTPTHHQDWIETIVALNEILRNNDIAHNYILIDIHTLLKDSNGLIKKEYTTDGVHLSEEGYNIWTNGVKEYVVGVKQ